MSREMRSPTTEDSIALRAFAIVRRRWIVATVAVATVLAAAVAFALYLPDLYRAHAIVLVERPLGDVVRPAVGNELESRLHVIQQTILSRDRLTQLVNRFQLYPELRKKASFEDVLAQAREDIDWEPNGPEQVSGRAKTVTFTLSYTGDDRKVVSDVTNAVAAFYVDYNEQMRASEAQSTTQFFKAQLDAARAQLDTAEQKMNAFVAANERLLPQAAAVNAATYTRLSDALSRNQAEQNRIEDRILALEQAQDAAARAAAAAAPRTATAQTVPGLEPSKEFTELVGQLNKAKETLAALEREGKGAVHPDVRTATGLIATLEEQVDAQRALDVAAHNAKLEEQKRAAAAAAAATTTPPVTRPAPSTRGTIAGFQAELKGLQDTEAKLRAELDAMLQRFDSSPGVQQDFLTVQTDYRSAKERFDVAQRKFDEAKISEGVEATGQGERFRVLEAAIPPEGPSAPNRLRLLLMGLLLALAAGAAAVVAAEQMDTSFHTVDDLREFTAIPVLATIPQIGGRPRRGYLRVALGTVSAVAAIVLVGTLSAYIANGNETLVRMLQRAG
jgi:polysaccharide chain length determinant protein (PEP-CTERM system associated)